MQALRGNFIPEQRQEVLHSIALLIPVFHAFLLIEEYEAGCRHGIAQALRFASCYINWPDVDSPPNTFSVSLFNLIQNLLFEVSRPVRERLSLCAVCGPEQVRRRFHNRNFYARRQR